MLNHVTIQGRMTRDVELRSTNSGKSVASFTVAWSEKYKENEQKVFLPCVVWGNQAEFVSKYFSKGQECLVEGKLVSRKWQDKDGNNRETIELIADRVHFCGPKAEGGQTGGYSGNYSAAQSYAQAAPAPGQFAELDEDDGDLPFN